MSIYFYNTLTRKKEAFRPLKNKKVGLYACGPTVYWFAHLGNMRSYLFEDLLRRVLEYNGYKVKHVINITDVGHLTSDKDTGEDKMEKGAKREGKTAQEISDFYTIAFISDLKTLNIEQPSVFCRATEYIKEQIALVKILEKKNFTYKLPDGIYFDTAKLKKYGRLAPLDKEGLKAGARVEMTLGKKNPTDFALWKFTPVGVKRQQEWNSPWGKGWPGWHLECSAMSQKYLGRQFDIHCGGIDHIQIHHTNEIAQSEAAYGKIPAKFWLHNAFLLIDGDRMGKSEGNLVTLDKIIPKFNPLAYRYLTLTAHYRSPLNLTIESLEASQIALNNLYRTMWELKTNPITAWPTTKFFQLFADKKIKNILKKVEKYDADFLQAINNDLDTPKALSVVWRLVDDQFIPATPKKQLLEKFDQVLGLKLKEVKITRPPKKIKKMVAEREAFRQKKDWLKSDVLRAQIENAGWLVEDTNQGPKLKPKR